MASKIPIMLTIDSLEPIGNVNARIHEIEGIPLIHQRLFIVGKNLEDDT